MLHKIQCLGVCKFSASYTKCERARFDGEYGTIAHEESVQKEYEQRIEDMSVEEPPFNAEKAQNASMFLMRVHAKNIGMNPRSFR